MSNIVAYTYDPADVILIVGGVPIEAWGTDSMITLTREANVNEKQVGTLGDVTLNKSRNLTGTLSITVKAQSDEDMMFDQLSGVSGLYSFPLVMKIASSNKILETNAWIETVSDLGVGTQIDDRVHVLGLANASLAAIDSANSLYSQVESINLG